MWCFGLEVKESIVLGRAINSVREKDDFTGKRYSPMKSKSFYEVDETIREMLFDEYLYADGSRVGFSFKDSSAVNDNLFHFVSVIDNNLPSEFAYNPNICIQVHINEFREMSVYSKIVLLRNTVVVHSGIMFIQMNSIQDIGQYGRRYNTLNLIARDDRKHISLLNGVDMESALQVIVFHLMKKYFPNIELPKTKQYIDNKKQTRIEVAELLGTTIEIAKMEITSIYQGRWYQKKYEPIKEYFNERDMIMKSFASFIGSNQKDYTLSTAIKYATRRAQIKIDSKYATKYKVVDYHKIDARNGKYKLSAKMRFAIEKTFTYFLWTFYERIAQNIVASRFQYPFTLHDAVYTQNIEEFNNLDIADIEREIFESIDMPIKF